MIEQDNTARVSSLGVPGVPWHVAPQILADQLTLSEGQIIPTK